MKKEDLLKVKYRKPCTSVFGRVIMFLFGLEIALFKSGYFHTYSRYSDGKYATAIIEEEDGKVVEVPNNNIYLIKKPSEQYNYLHTS